MRISCAFHRDGVCVWGKEPVTEAYCKEVCRGRCTPPSRREALERIDGKPKRVIVREPQPRRSASAAPTLTQMTAHFTKAMVRWAKSGFDIVSQEEYIRRRQICAACSDGWRCPKCGCMLWAKVALKTEQCKKWDVS